MINGDVCSTCQRYHKDGGLYQNLPESVWTCAKHYTPGDMGVAGINLNAGAVPPEWCVKKFEQGVASAIDLNM